jgi:hypothetical protein
MRSTIEWGLSLSPVYYHSNEMQWISLEKSTSVPEDKEKAFIFTVLLHSITIFNSHPHQIDCNLQKVKTSLEVVAFNYYNF